MFQRILNAIAGDYNQRQLNTLLPYIKRINDLDAEWMTLSDEQIQAKTVEFKQRYIQGESLDDMLPEAFATVKQACRRMKGMVCIVKGQEIVRDMVPYDVQLLGGMVLHYGKIAEMKTGEGKTLVATLPVYLNALSGKGVHLVTVNDYLASRDSEWMGYLYHRLGLTTGAITKGTPLHTRRAAYASDITYVENSELGFDYLRDNLAKSNQERQLLRRPLNFAIVDEVDSILIDEARTPLIISYPSEEPTEKYMYYGTIVRQLTPCTHKKRVSKGFIGDMLRDDQVQEEEDGDYYIDEKNKNVTLSGRGIEKLEKIIGVENLYKDLGYDEIHHIENALRAMAVYENNKDYIVQEGEILIVDEHTGRTMPGRRYSEGLHQAIEAKERVVIQKESKTMATITYQNFFKIYHKLCGMTGTATTEGEEFEKIYGLEVLSIPTNRPTIRVDQNDKVFFNQTAKWKAVMDYIRFYHDAGVPLLIGTSSIQTSEYVSDLLRSVNIQHYVLNAKFHQQEAEIVTNAGKWKSVVVATNMAGRGTDIKLEKGLGEKIATGYAQWASRTIQGDTFTKTEPQGVSYTVYSSQEYEYTIAGLQSVFGFSDEAIRQATQDRYAGATSRIKITMNTHKKEKQVTGVFAQITLAPLNLPKPLLVERDLHYGLFILGTEKHESRRIDNQLRGRAGRQGDPGSSVFFVALDDDIMRKMGGEKIQAVAKMLLPKEQLEQLELTQSQFTNSIIRAQKQMEGWNFSIRKHLFDYDSVINRQRQRIYAKRDELLLGQENEDDMQQQMTPLMSEVHDFIPDIAAHTYETYRTLGIQPEGLYDALTQDFGLSFASEHQHPGADGSDTLTPIASAAYSPETIAVLLTDAFTRHIQNQHVRVVDATIRMIYLSIIDKYWVDHIDAMQYLRDKVGLYGYAQQDPLIMYKHEAFTKFQHLFHVIKKDTLGMVLKTDFAIGGWGTPAAAALPSQDNTIVFGKLQEAAASLPQIASGQAASGQAIAQQKPASQYAKAFAQGAGPATYTVGASDEKKTYGRNDIVVLIAPTGEEKEMKYKKIDEYIAKGWYIKKS